jgi:hypothetical protein
MLAALFLCLLVQAPPALSASKHTDPLPPGFAAPVAGALAPGGVRATASGATLTFWFVRALPLAEGAKSAAWEHVPEGSLVGGVQIDHDFRDIRGRVIKAGLYTLRYGIQPANGDHLGVSPYRDFLLLSPASLDTDVAPRGHDGTIDLSKQTIGGSHPAVWSIDPPSTTADLLSLQKTDLGHSSIVVEVPASAAGAGAGALRFGIVLVGKIEA